MSQYATESRLTLFWDLAADNVDDRRKCPITRDREHSDHGSDSAVIGKCPLGSAQSSDDKHGNCLDGRTDDEQYSSSCSIDKVHRYERSEGVSGVGDARKREGVDRVELGDVERSVLRGESVTCPLEEEEESATDDGLSEIVASNEIHIGPLVPLGF